MASDHQSAKRKMIRVPALVWYWLAGAAIAAALIYIVDTLRAAGRGF